MTITVKARHPALGAEIHGIDMRQPANAATLQQVSDAWMKHLVLVFPGQHITDREHVDFTRQLGEPEIFHQTSLHLRSDAVREIFLVSNVDERGKLMRPTEPSQKQLSSSQMWHTDSSYRPVPSMGRASSNFALRTYSRRAPRASSSGHVNVRRAITATNRCAC